MGAATFEDDEDDLKIEFELLIKNQKEIEDMIIIEVEDKEEDDDDYLI